MLLRIVDEGRNLLRPDLLPSVSKHKQHGVDHIALATAIRANDRSETFMKRTQNLLSYNVNVQEKYLKHFYIKVWRFNNTCVWFKEFVFNVSDDESGSRCLKCAGGGRRRRNVNIIWHKWVFETFKFYLAEGIFLLPMWMPPSGIYSSPRSSWSSAILAANRIDSLNYYIRLIKIKIQGSCNKGFNAEPIAFAFCILHFAFRI